MKRDRYSDLLAWKNLPARKPLILRGARQVGKTYLLKEFGRREYKNISRISRLKQSGMEWTGRGANAIIALRCVMKSNRLEDYWESRAA